MGGSHRFGGGGLEGTFGLSSLPARCRSDSQDHVSDGATARVTGTPIYRALSTASKASRSRITHQFLRRS